MKGTRIGSYRLTKLLGEGGMGAVYLAEHVTIEGQYKAIKLLDPELSKDPFVLARFKTEAQAAAHLKHPKIVGIDDFAQLPEPDGRWYIMMPLLEGASLSRVLLDGGPFSIHRALHVLIQVCEALQYVHDRGYVHRDLKPENIFLSSERPNGLTSTARLIDFGIAKPPKAVTGAQTRSGAVLGTPAFISVEQYENAAAVDGRADIFALGVIAHVMLSMQFPFGSPSDNWMALYNRQRHEAPVPLPPSVPAGWRRVIGAALSPDPSDRPQSARAFGLLLASETPGDAMEPSGLDAVRAHAPELLDVGPLAQTTRHVDGIEHLRVLLPMMGLGLPSPRGATPVRSVPTPVAAASFADDSAVPIAVEAAQPPSLATVEERLRQAPRLPPGLLPGQVPVLDPAQVSVPLPSRPTTISAASGPVVSVSPARPTRFRSLVLVGAAASLLIAAVALTALVMRSRTPNAAVPDDQRTNEIARPAPAAVDAAVPVAAAAAPIAMAVEQLVTITTTPEGAELTVDGTPIGVSPASVKRRVGATLSIEAERVGYKRAARTFDIASDTHRIELRLVRARRDDAQEKGPEKKPFEAAPSPPATPADARPPTRPAFDPDDVISR